MIIVCPLSHAPRIAREQKPSHVVSLLDPGSHFPALADYGHDRHLCIEAHDINDPDENLDAVCDLRMKRILDFAGSWDRAQPMLVHCYAGISRSSATAYITACLHNPSANEEEIALALRKASPAAWPNKRFVALADAELGRNGRMNRAIASIGDGHNWYDIGENTPFDIPSRFSA